MIKKNLRKKTKILTMPHLRLMHGSDIKRDTIKDWKKWKIIENTKN